MSRIVPILALAAMLAAAEPAPRLATDGIHVAAAGPDMVLSWPSLQDAAYARTAYSAVALAADGRSAVLDFPGGAKLGVALAGDGFDIDVERCGDAASVCVELVIPAAMRTGGAWTCGETSGSFPAAKPEQPHFFGGNASGFVLRHDGAVTLSLGTPDFAFQQMTDNRAWNWDVCTWRSVVPVGDRRVQHYSVRH